MVVFFLAAHRFCWFHTVMLCCGVGMFLVTPAERCPQKRDGRSALSHWGLQSDARSPASARFVLRVAGSWL